MLRGLFFQARGSLTSLKFQTRDLQLKVPPGGLVLRIFTSWKNSSTSVGFEPANFGSRDEHVTPRPTALYISPHVFLFSSAHLFLFSWTNVSLSWKGSVGIMLNFNKCFIIWSFVYHSQSNFDCFLVLVNSQHSWSNLK